MRKFVLSRSVVASLLSFGIVFVAMADEQNVKKSQSKITSESKDSYAALGLRVGSFMVLPTAESENDWNDNIYSRQTDTRSDFIFHIKPALNIKSNWSRHSLNLSANADVMFYKDYTKEDKQNYSVSLDGKFDVIKDSFATAKLYYQNNKEDRGSPNAVASSSASPLENETFGATVGYEHKINRLKANLSHDIKQIDYKNGVDAFGGEVPNSQRTRTVNASEARLGYELFSGYETYIKAVYNFVDYRSLFTAPVYTINGVPLDRSSQGYKVEVGVTADIGHTLVGDAHFGYQNQDYASATLKSIGGMSGGLALTWLPTRLTTIKVGVDRSVQETTQIGLSGFFTTSLTTSVDHELMRNVLLNAHAGYTNNDYHGTNKVLRQEDLFNAGFKIKYLLNRYFFLQAGYDYKNRAVNIYGSDYDINNVYLTIGTQL